jgi:hypothetical protein
MNSHHPQAAEIARKYIGTDEPLEVLGWGLDGVVYARRDPTAAVKIHNKDQSFQNELAVYRRLSERHVEKFMGFQVPVLLDYREQDRLLELSVVKPPFLLDFAAATVDKAHDFTEEAMGMWWNDVEENFGDDFPIASAVFHGLKKQLGIYYWDLKPRNLVFR